MSAKDFTDRPLPEVEKLLESHYDEVRMGVLRCVTLQNGLMSIRDRSTLL